MPAIGFGTFQDKDKQESAVYHALNAGFRHIDTAYAYTMPDPGTYRFRTETAVQNAMRKAGVRREDVFLTTKLWCTCFHPDDVETALDRSLRFLGTDYVDLFLMHYPCAWERGTTRIFPKMKKHGSRPMGDTKYIDTWKTMETLPKAKVRAIGVSNFSRGEVQTLLDEGSVVPAVHQMELHPYLQQTSFADWHRAQGIHVTQFSPLGNTNPYYRSIWWATGKAAGARLIYDPVLVDVGWKHGKSAAQVALAWGLANGRSVLSKSVDETRIRENLDSDFALDGEDVARIATLDRALRFNDPSAAFGWNLYSDLKGSGRSRKASRPAWRPSCAPQGAWANDAV
ncbi:hypothetical protein SLS54_009724 [Diplodia seriata]